MTTRTKSILALLALCTVCGCVAKVPAYQRGRILSRAMQANPAIEQGQDIHVQQTRESALGAAGASGASCGCN